MEIKKKSRQINEIEPREIRNKGSNKGDFSKTIKVR